MRVAELWVYNLRIIDQRLNVVRILVLILDKGFLRLVGFILVVQIQSVDLGGEGVRILGGRL